MERDLKKLISQMTLEEKAGLCSGQNFWNTKAIERWGIPSIMMCDGPHGLRKQAAAADHLGMNQSVPATCFPSAAGTACSWDLKLMERMGEAIGRECRAEDVAILLGPGANIKRSPLCGRNFEYFSEDPYLSSQMAAGHIKGVQSQGVGTSLKHYAANNQETLRMTIDSVVDERTLREIYLASFEEAVKIAQPWTVMCSYNKVNGTYASEDPFLLTDVLKKEWGHEGYVVSDWAAVNDRVAGLEAGLELEMPFSGGERDAMIVSAVQEGRLSEQVLDDAVERLLKITFKAVDNKLENAAFDPETHHRLCREVAGESMVLLKNHDGLLPLKKEGTLAVIGGFARKPRFQGGGSSHINPTFVDDAIVEMEKIGGPGLKISYAQGYRMDEGGGIFNSKEFRSDSDVADEALIAEAVEEAGKAAGAVIFTGLPDSYESEGYDRKHLRIPEGHSKLIEAVSRVQKNVVVVLSNGSPIEMPWLNQVKGILEGYLGGQAFGGAVADLLFGEANPCGKLAETFPMKLSDNPSYLNFPGDMEKVEYREGIFVGYRHYDAMALEVLFPFGYGLSYTTFDYTGITLDKPEMTDEDTLKVSVGVKNTGKLAGKEIVQLYVRDVKSRVIRPIKELKGFQKVSLQPGEEKTVEFSLGKRGFAYYEPKIKDWLVETGEFEILVGRSSREILLTGKVKVQSTTAEKKVYTRNTTIGEILEQPAAVQMMGPVLKELQALFGGGGDEGAVGSLLSSMPLRGLVALSGGALSEALVQKMLDGLNGIG